MELELEPRVKPLPFKVKASSRESPSQKATNVLDPDLRTHWSTATNTKEWILLELDEPCLLSHIRIYNKSVLEWEITVGLRYKPENFIKVRPRCESPRRDMLYPMNYTACRYVRISCMRGNPIAIFFIQLIGVSVPGLEAEFQPVVNYLLPHIISHKQDAEDIYLQLLRDISNRLFAFLPHLENDLNIFPEAADSKIRFLAMLVGPFYPILHLVNERSLLSASDSDGSRNRLSSTLTISSNFEVQPRRSRSPSPFSQLCHSSIAFRPEAAFLLLRKAYENSHLGIICRTASRALQNFLEPITYIGDSIPIGESSPSCNADCIKNEGSNRFNLNDYSSLFGEEFKIYNDYPENSCMKLLDISLVEEAILHVLYASASEPVACGVLADNVGEFWSLLPLIQALLPALRPFTGTTLEQVDETFCQWKNPLVQHALSQIILVSSSSVSRSLLHASAGYLLSFQQSQVRTACVLIDLHFGPLAPWATALVMKIDLAIELLEDLLDTIQCASQSPSRARAALKYVVLGLSGHMDDVLAKYKEVNRKVLFLVEMLEPFLDPTLSTSKCTITFGDVSTTVREDQEQTCAIALNVIRTAVRRAAVLPSLESEWRLGTVAPSVLLSILGPHMTLPDEIDMCKCTIQKAVEKEGFPSKSGSSSAKLNGLDESGARCDLEALSKTEGSEDANFLFAPTELKNIELTNNSFPEGFSVIRKSSQATDNSVHDKHTVRKILVDPTQNSLHLKEFSSSECLKFKADYLQLRNLDDAERRAAEFQRLALDLHLQVDTTPEGNDAAIDALLLAAECYINPFFLISFRSNPQLLDQLITLESGMHKKTDINDLDLYRSETKRDKAVLELLLEAAKWENEFQRYASKEIMHETDNYGYGVQISVEDMEYADAVTLLRQNQALLCRFLTQRLLSNQQTPHEVLLQALCFYLRTASELFCPPHEIVEIIIQYAEHVNRLMTSFYNEVKDCSETLKREKVYIIQHHWSLLQNLVMASSGTDIGLNRRNTASISFYGSLVPLVAWIQKLPSFSLSQYPLGRFVGWMAISYFAKQYVKEWLFLTLDLSNLTSLLTIFLDDIALVDIVNEKIEARRSEDSNVRQTDNSSEPFAGRSAQGSFNKFFPDLHIFLPDLKLHFRSFEEFVLEAVALQLKAMPAIAISDILCWFSGFCLSPFSQKQSYLGTIVDSGYYLKGNSGRNMKAVILYLLESIVSAHMEAMIPEMPRVAQILMSLCKVPYYDVDFLDACLRLLCPLISYALRKACDNEKMPNNNASYYDFETLCFEEIFDLLKDQMGGKDGSSEQIYQASSIIFLLGSLFGDLSVLRKKEILQYVTLWADFTLTTPSSHFDYLKAFLIVFNSCIKLLVQSLKLYDVPVPVQLQVNDEQISSPGDALTSFISLSSDAHASITRRGCLLREDMEEISRYLEKLLSKVYPTLESCWKFHFQLSHNLTVALGKCYLLMRCLASVTAMHDNIGDENITPENSLIVSDAWKNALEGFVMQISALQNNYCWQSACVMLDFLLGLPEAFTLDHIFGSICLAIKGFCAHAPRISWRLQSDKWLSLLFNRSRPLREWESSLLDLFSSMLCNSEPEQRAVALRQLGRLVGLDVRNRVQSLSYGIYQDNISAGTILSISEKTVFNLVSGTWDRVTTLASCDSLLLLRANAMALLSGFIPFAERSQLQSLFASADSIIPRRAPHTSPTQEPLMQISLSLLAHACVYSKTEDICLIPEGVWENLESISKSTAGFSNVEKKICGALLDLRNEVEDAKEVLNNVLPSSFAVHQSDPNFGNTRESILEILPTASSMQSYLDFFSTQDQEAQELEEAEIEIELLLKENVSQESLETTIKEPSPVSKSQELPTTRLKKLKAEIHNLERSRLRVEVAARRQKKLLAQHTRQKYLEEAASREMELLQQLDRERANEIEREIERQRSLEIERAKTRELHYNLDLERERRAQRELQKELEQVESGVQLSRREFSSNTSGGRTRERYRDRDSGIVSHEGTIRPSSRGRENVQGATSGLQVPTLVLSGSNRSFSQIPTILQSQNRTDERGTSYEESFDGSRDSGDTGSIGDPDVSGFDGLQGGFGPGGRHGSRGNKARQILERREREARREGKWERKHA